MFPNEQARIETTKAPITATTIENPIIQVVYSPESISLAGLKSYIHFLVTFQSQKLFAKQIQRINEGQIIFHSPKTPAESPERKPARAPSSQSGFIRFG